MKRISILLVFLSLLSFTTFSQIDSKETVRLQQQLKKVLIKSTKDVYAVDYNGCEASIKISMPSFQPSGAISTVPAFGYGGFPTDTETFHGGYEPRPLTSFRYLLDLSKLDGAKISHFSGWRKDFSIIEIDGATTAGAIRTLKKGKENSVDKARFVLRAKDADRASETFKSLIATCSATK